MRSKIVNICIRLFDFEKVQMCRVHAVSVFVSIFGFNVSLKL